MKSQEAHDLHADAFVSTTVGPRRQLYRLGRLLYHAVPSRIRAFLYPIATNAVLLRRLRPEIWVVSGEEKSTHLPLSICLYCVTQEYKNTVQNLIFDSRQETYLGRGWMWNAFKPLPAAVRNCSIVIAEVHERHLKWTGKDAGIVIPAWIRGYVSLPRCPAIMNNLNIKRILRRVRQHQLAYTTTRDPKTFDYFYRRMYVPYSKARFGESAFIFSRDKVWEMFNRGELLMVSKDGEYVVGQIVIYENDYSAYMPFQGVLDGNREFVTAGAVEAAYEFTLQHLEKNGFQSVSLGQTQAFLNDGVLQFKRRFGHTISGTTEHKYVARVLSDTPSVRAFLKSNPFIFQLSDGLRGAVFLDHENSTPQALQDVYKQYFHPGLLEVLVLFLSGYTSQTSEPESDRLQIDDLITTLNTPQNEAEYRWLTKEEYSPLIDPLGPLPIAAAVAIQPANASRQEA